MATHFPTPIAGLVIRYSYLWHREHEQGREEGLKDRPCAIIAAIRMEEGNPPRVLVLPITHSQPENAELAMEIPWVTKQRLGLDTARSWIIISEWNEFNWPGPDLRRVDEEDNSTIIYGFLPPTFFAMLRKRFTALAQNKKSARVERTE